MEINIEDVVIVQDLYFRSGIVRVQSGYLKTDPARKLVLKQVFGNNVAEMNDIMEEAYAMSHIEHPQIIEIRGIHFENSNLQPSITFIMDFFERGDLQAALTRRASTRNFWTNDQLRHQFSSLIQVFAFLEGKQIVHRDIKPQNLFVASDTQLKVGDLGCAKRSNLMESAQSLVGTPVYMSPALREALIQQQLNGIMSFTHNEVKSDVFSLGLVFLYMATLEPPLEKLTRLSTQVAQLIARVEDIQLRQLLTEMLQFEETLRPTFIELACKYQLVSPPEQIKNTTQLEIEPVGGETPLVQSPEQLFSPLSEPPQLQATNRVGGLGPAHLPYPQPEFPSSQLECLANNYLTQSGGGPTISDYKGGHSTACLGCGSVSVEKPCCHGYICIACGMTTLSDTSCLLCWNPRVLCGYCENHKVKIPRQNKDSYCISCKHPRCSVCMGDTHSGYPCNPQSTGQFIYPTDKETATQHPLGPTLVERRNGDIHCLVCGFKTKSEHARCLQLFSQIK